MIYLCISSNQFNPRGLYCELYVGLAYPYIIL